MYAGVFAAILPIPRLDFSFPRAQSTFFTKKFEGAEQAPLHNNGLLPSLADTNQENRLKSAGLLLFALLCRPSSIFDNNILDLNDWQMNVLTMTTNQWVVHRCFWALAMKGAKQEGRV